MSFAIASPWTPFGLRSDPYFQEPLTAEAGADHPIDLFVGRGAELSLLARQVVGSSSSRAIVEGEAGVGKTTFVNRLKAVLADRALAEQPALSHTQPVRVTGGMTPSQFCAEVLRTLLLIRAARNAPRAEPESADGAARATRSTRRAPHRESPTEEAFWRRVQRTLLGEDGVALGLSLGGFGGAREATRIAPERGELSLYEELTEAFGHLGRTLVHVNNLERLPAAGAARAAQLIEDLRDYFLIPNSHWIFVGATGVEHAIFRRSRQVSSVIPVAITLAPLPTNDVVDLLGKRYVHLARHERWLPPVANDAVAALYARYHGDLRNFLRVLSHAVQRHPMADPPKSLSIADVLATMAPSYRAELEGEIGADARHLAAVVRGAGADVTFRVADVKKATGMTQPGASQLIQRLIARGVVALDRTEGRSTYYRLSGNAGIAFGLP